ncbi:MAG TPA: EthD family reductase [Candidatus Acidoferrum sp.]|nr:EthD family reductase [Candidatus Acidoferrum sp.]
MTVKLVVIYPRPDDIEAFETVYNRDHVPMAVAKLGGKTKIVASKIVGSPQGTPPFHRIAEIHFPSMGGPASLRPSEGGKQTIANAVAISSGGAPIFLVGSAARTKI